MHEQSYDSKFLKIYSELPPTPLQQEEDLEQLKVLENGYKMKVPKYLFLEPVIVQTSAEISPHKKIHDT